MSATPCETCAWICDECPGRADPPMRDEHGHVIGSGRAVASLRAVLAPDADLALSMMSTDRALEIGARYLAWCADRGGFTPGNARAFLAGERWAAPYPRPIECPRCGARMIGSHYHEGDE